jgi:hypothetical protein
MIRIVATITDFGAAVNVGGDPERISEIINIPTNSIPPSLKKYLHDANIRKWATLSLSMMAEDLELG